MAYRPMWGTQVLVPCAMRLRLRTFGRVGLGAMWLLHAACSDDATAVDDDSAGTAADTETSTGGETVCMPGSVEACTCSDGATGERQCVSDGSGYGACECDPSGTTSDTGEDTTTGLDGTDTDSASETGETETDTSDTGVECTDDCSMIEVSACQEAVCNQEIGQCEIVHLVDGTDCSSFCRPDGVCAAGACVGTPNDCGLVPEQCEVVTCDDESETCGYGEAADGTACVLDDLCLLDPVCDAGICVETDVVDCGGGNACVSAECNPGTGECEEEADDGAICTSTYFLQSFASCVGTGWGLFGDWQCGTPTVGPEGCIDGSQCIGTVLAGDYNHNQSYDLTVAELPPISLTGATSPLLAYWHWVDTENCCDGYNVWVSTNGANWSVLGTVEPPYPNTVNGAPAYGGRIQTWERITADLSAYAGQTVWLRFAFRSDGSGAYPGVFIDDVRVAEPQAILLSIDTATLPFAEVGESYGVTLQRSGGTDQVEWSIVGGVNAGWLTIDPSTGVLSGTPAVANEGPVQVTVRVQEPTLPENFAERSYDLAVVSPIYSESFESCPAGWSFGGDWQCGVPTSGPGAAYHGSQCIATVLAGNYNNNQAWNVATATSPSIVLPAGTPLLSFRIWLHTEGSSYDGTNLKISTDGGATFNVVTAVTPNYPLTVNSQPAWGGNQSAAGWQEFTADLAAYAGQTVQLQFGFRSDGSVVHPGVYVDQFRILN